MKRRISLPSVSAVPAVLLSILSVQSGASIAKKLFPVLGASGTCTLRIGLSAILLAFINRPSLRGMSAKQWLTCALYGICLGSMNIFFYLGISRIPLGLGVTLEFMGPLTLALLCSRKIKDLVWAILAGLGISLIAPWGADSGVDPLGVIFTLCAGTCWALYIVMGGVVSKLVSNKQAVTFGLFFASLFILPFGIISGDLMALTWPYFFMALGVAVFSSAIPFTLEFIGLQNLPAKTFSILMSLHPAVAALFGLIFLGELLSFTQCLSIICVVGASIGSTLSKTH